VFPQILDLSKLYLYIQVWKSLSFIEDLIFCFTMTLYLIKGIWCTDHSIPKKRDQRGIALNKDL